MSATADTAQQARMGAPEAGDRILVVAPHPDDETLCCGGYVLRAHAAGAAVGIVWITAGDAFEIDALLLERHLRLRGRGMRQLGEARIAEALAAARLLEVQREHAYVLGFPDQGIGPLLDAAPDTPYRSPFTLSETIPYADARSPGATITARRLLEDLLGVIEEFRPTQVLSPAAEDVHPDHRACSKLVRRALAQRTRNKDLFEYVVHAGRHWPAPRGLHPDLPLAPAPAALLRTWLSFDLTAAEREQKLRALRAHRTQLDLMAPFLESFVRSNELFTRG